jgi:hypothetical protein
MTQKLWIYKSGNKLVKLFQQNFENSATKMKNTETNHTKAYRKCENLPTKFSCYYYKKMKHKLQNTSVYLLGQRAVPLHQSAVVLQIHQGIH